MLIDYSSLPPVQELSRPSRHLENYRRIYETSERETRQEYGPKALAGYLAAYDAIGADHVVVKARDVETTFGVKISNEDVALFCKDHAPRFLGLAGVDPHKGMAAVRELEYAVRELGLRGLNLQCFEHKLPINDPKMYPL
jgi:predicted TIM-barrel fold metal-dependent hydrolase